MRIHRSQIEFATYNPRVISSSAEVALDDSLSEFGLVSDPVWNAFNGVLIAGHQRIKRIDKLEGHQNYFIDVKKVHIEDVRVEKALNIALNNQNMQGEYDISKLLDMYKNDEFDIEMTGFRDIDLETLGYEAGIGSDLLESIFSPQATELLGNIADEVDSLQDEADALKRREKDRKKEQSRKSGKGANDVEDGDSDDDSFDSDSDSEFGMDDSDSEAAEDPDENATSPAYADKIKAGRQLTDNMKAAAESNYHLTISFAGDAQKIAFCEAVGFNPHSRFESGATLAKIFNIKLPPVKKKGESSGDNVSES